MRIAASFVLFGLAALGALAGSAAASDPPLASTSTSCHENIGIGVGPMSRPRALLGRADLPSFVSAVRIRGGPRPWFAKQGVGIRQGKLPVVISVPPAWRSRIAIGWNNRGGVEASIEQFPGCDGNAWIGAPGGPSNHYLSYPGGFYVAEPGCYPLDVQVGTRRARAFVFIESQRKIGSGSQPRCPPRSR